ncbi:MAG: clostripain-related cysteine peptidase [Methanothrix sp.]
MSSKWTYMVYMAGDNNLSTAGDEDLKEMRQVGSSSDINILVQFDNAGNEGTRRFHIKRGGVNDKVEDLGKTDSGDPHILEDFIAWCCGNYPADRYALILWNHGGGWEPGDLDRMARSERTKNWNAREASSRSASKLKKTFFSTTVSEILNLGTPKLREICCDDGSGHSLDTIELGEVLAFAMDKIGQPLDILGMDACLMSNLEVAYQAEPYVRYIVASEENEPNEGWPYNAILGMLNKNPEISTPEFCSKIVRLYTKTYKEWGQSDVTQSAFDLSRIKDTTKCLDSLAEALIDQMPGIVNDIRRAQRISMSFDDDKLWDISHFCKELSGLTQENSVVQATQKVIEEFEPDSEKLIIAESHLGQDYDHCCGASIYMPTWRISKYYADLKFAKDIKNWPLMLQNYNEY